MEEKVVFERAFHMHGKNFHRLKAFVSHYTAQVCIHGKICLYVCTCVGGWVDQFITSNIVPCAYEYVHTWCLKL